MAREELQYILSLGTAHDKVVLDMATSTYQPVNTTPSWPNFKSMVQGNKVGEREQMRNKNKEVIPSLDLNLVGSFWGCWVLKCLRLMGYITKNCMKIKKPLCLIPWNSTQDLFIHIWMNTWELMTLIVKNGDQRWICIIDHQITSPFYSKVNKGRWKINTQP